jgi:HD-GYP domain-containing protein (c-di-GMP phosphodiesterase class II)
MPASPSSCSSPSPLSTVRLLPVPAGTLRPGDLAPVNIYDAEGSLLLAEGRAVDNEKLLDILATKSVFIDEGLAHKWKGLRPAPLKNMLPPPQSPPQAPSQPPPRPQAQAQAPVGDAKPDSTFRESQFLDTGYGKQLSLVEEWDSLHRLLTAALLDAAPRSDWLARVIRAHRRVQQLGNRSLDGSLYYLVYRSSQPEDHYSALHAMLVCLVCQAAARVLGWPRDWVQALGLAALTMNVTMTELQDTLGNSDITPTMEMRQEIEQHSIAAQELLKSSGVEDAIWTGAVRWHHSWQQDHIAFEELAPPNKLARLLMRVDIFTARLSRRKYRGPMSPLQAAKRACIGPNGKLDEIGSALLKALGLYPPGTFVSLANQEVGIVISRGSRADLPRVASLRAADGRPLPGPALRDTNTSMHRVIRSLTATEVNLVPNHELMISMI